MSYILSYGIVFGVFLVFFIALVGLSLVLFIINKKRYSKKKRSPYECGFDAFSDTRIKFDVKFYRIAVMFMIFDVEMILLVPFVRTVDQLGKIGLVAISIFFFILAIGLLYEWNRGALEWEE